MITAAGAGSAAAIAINADLVQDDVERAVNDHFAASQPPDTPPEPDPHLALKRTALSLAHASRILRRLGRL